MVISGWLSGLAPAFRPRCDPGVPGLSPASGSLDGAYFSLCLFLCLSLSLSLMIENKKIKKKKDHWAETILKGIFPKNVTCSIKETQ